MKAAVFRHYGSPDVINVEAYADPIPKPKQVLIKIAASTINSADWRIRSLSVPAGFGFLVRLSFGLLKPRFRILGLELSGKIVQVGSAVTRFNIGDEVIASTGFNMGAHAELIALNENATIIPKPASLDHNTASALSFGGVTALHFLKHKGQIKAGEKLLINGASGTVGTAAIQIAKHLGAQVTAVSSGKNHDTLKSIGADQVIDYEREDFTQSAQTWDLIMDNVGKLSFPQVAPSFNRQGRFLMVVAGFKDTFLAPFSARKYGIKAITGTAKERKEDLRFLAELAESGEFSPVIDSVFGLDDIREAHKRVDTGRKVGSVVITMD